MPPCPEPYLREVLRKDANPAREAGDIYEFKVLVMYNDANPAGDAGDIYHASHEFKMLVYYFKWRGKVNTTTPALLLRPGTWNKTSRYKNVCPSVRSKYMMKLAQLGSMIVMMMALFWLMIITKGMMMREMMMTLRSVLEKPSLQASLSPVSENPGRRCKFYYWAGRMSEEVA